MLELLFVRHGESVRNYSADLAHHGDTSLLEYQLRFECDEAAWDLTQKGIEQAKIAGAWIQEKVSKEFDLYFVSPFKRTRQTAASLGLPGSQWRVDDRIREREWGDYMAPGFSSYDVDQYLRDLSHCAETRWRGRFPGSESIEDLIPRCRSFVTDLFRECPSGRVISVTHGGAMKALEFVIERLPTEQDYLLADRHLANCSILHYLLDNFDGAGNWSGSVRSASPALSGAPFTDWQPLAGQVTE